MFSTNNPAKILIVEDDPMLASFVALVVEGEGHTIAGIAATSKAARNMACESVDLALVDCNLADGLTGMELGRELADKYNIAVIYCTGQPEVLSNDIPGAIGVLTKPATADMIASAVVYGLKVKLFRELQGKCPTGLRMFRDHLSYSDA